MSKPVNIKEDNFDKIVTKATTPVLVDFWAPWCGPCLMVAPVVDQLAAEYEGKIAFGKVNVDECPQIAGKYGVMSIPSLIIFKGGVPVANIVGFRPKEQLKKSLDAVLG